MTPALSVPRVSVAVRFTAPPTRPLALVTARLLVVCVIVSLPIALDAP